MPNSKQKGKAQKPRKAKKLSHRPFKKQTLAEQVTASIEASIIDGKWAGGDALPTEPEIAEQFGVSRAVVRDATRMLAAKGLVEAQHGKGVFVTHSPVGAFGDALLLALRRMDATNWDVTEFEQLLLPEVVALAAQNASADDLVRLRTAADRYLTLQAEAVENGIGEQDSAEFQAFEHAWLALIQAIFDATHNKLIALLAQPLMRIHGVRHWSGLSQSMSSLEKQLVDSLYELIASRDSANARQQTQQLLALPPEAIAALQATTVGDVTYIRMDSAEST